MSRFAWLACLVLAVPAAGLAEGKCGDAPFPIQPNKLIVTWVLPVPAGASVQEVGGAEFSAAGGEKHPELPVKYDQTVQTNAALWRAQSVLARSVTELEVWESKYQIVMTPEPRRLLQSYVDSGFQLYGTLVDHPSLGAVDPKTYTLCSCVNQRGIIYHDGKEERLYVRSRFASAQSASSPYKNFTPAGGLMLTINRPTIWFPLRFSEVAQEDRTYVVLDVLTPNGINIDWVPRIFAAEQLAPRVVDGKTWQVVRLTGKLQRGTAATDLELPLK